MGKERIKRTEAYAEQVRRLFAETVNEILALYKTVPELGEREMFSFDADGQARRDKTTRLLRRLHSVATEAVRQGVKLEWGEANKEADAVIADLFGEEVRKNPAFAGWTKRNGKAAERFMNRAEDGIDLSDRIWKTVKQLREEMEVAMTVSIGEGESASSMSRKVRQYLNDPDLMFRRFKYKIGEDKDGKPVYGRKWKKRVKDEATGRYRWEDYDKDSYKVGRGYYKSSAKNAMRVTRTETNIAYRRADNLRWRQMDFVLGYHVEPSKAHPKPDICDKLKGDYPKWFNFDGWHPQCFCVCTPILLNDAEAMEMMLAKRDGKTYTPKQKPIDAVPANFSEWVRDNADKIAEARERGTEPYFLANNKQAVDDILHPKPKELTTLEKAELRHKARTQEQIDDIKKRWNARRAVNKYGGKILDTMKGIEGVDTSGLEKALRTADQKAIVAEAKKIASVGKEIKQDLYLLDNPLEVARKTSLESAKVIHANVVRTLGKMPSDLEPRMSKLEFEIKWMETEGAKRYPDTWQYSQAAYKKELEAVCRKIDIKSISDSVSDALAYSVTSRSKDFRTLADEMKKILSSPNTDIASAKEKARQLNDKYSALKTKRQKEVKGVTGVKTLEELKVEMGSNLPETLKHLDKAFADYKRADGDFVTNRIEIEKEMQRIFADNDLGMDISGKILESVYKNGFYNTFQSGSSDGYCGSTKTTGKIEVTHNRLKAAHKLFGLSPDLDKGQLLRAQYEKYGHLLDRDKKNAFLYNRTHYGRGNGGRENQVQVRFKRENVLCTWTFNDSLCQTFQPSLISDPKVESFDRRLDFNKRPLSTDTRNLYEWQNMKGTSYIELQYHGKLTIDDVDSMVFAQSPDLVIDEELIKKLKAKGINLYYYNGTDIVNY